MDGSFQEATRIEGWVEGSLSTTVFNDHLYLVHANPENGHIYIASSVVSTWRARVTTQHELGAIIN
jgi:aspartate carbamoyltransferase catalytic subunit